MTKIENDWISVKKALPKEGISVLVSIEDLNGFNNIKRTVRVGRQSSTISGLDGHNNYWEVDGENGDNAYRRITAWKPLDEPYVPEDACVREDELYTKEECPFCNIHAVEIPLKIHEYKYRKSEK